jgi:hypothetical protein
MIKTDSHEWGIGLWSIMQPENNAKPTASEILRALGEFAVTPEDEIEAQTTEELELFLSSHGVSIEPSTEELKDRLAAARNRIELTIARQERLSAHAGNLLSQATQAPLLAGKALRDAVQRRLNNLQPQAAAMFARDFQEGDDEDLRTILAALDQLETEDNSRRDKNEQD